MISKKLMMGVISFALIFSSIFVVTVIDADSSDAVTIGCTYDLPSATEGETYSHTLYSSADDIQYTAYSGSWPSGLSLTDGTLSGTPTESGSFSIVFYVEIYQEGDTIEDYYQYNITVDATTVDYVTAISMSPSSSTIEVGDSITLTVVLDSGTVYSTITWSYNSSYLTMDSQSGLSATFTAIASGSCTTGATMVANNTYYHESCAMTITSSSGTENTGDYSSNLSDYEDTASVRNYVGDTSATATTVTLTGSDDSELAFAIECIYTANQRGTLTTYTGFAPSWFTIEVSSTSYSITVTIAYGAVCDGTYFIVFDCDDLGVFALYSHITVTDSGSVTTGDYYGYDLSFNTNGGSSVSSVHISSQETTYDYDLSDTTTTRDGYTFTGWSTTSDCSSILVSSTITLYADEPVTLYAVWEEGSTTTSDSLIVVAVIVVIGLGALYMMSSSRNRRYGRY